MAFAPSYYQTDGGAHCLLIEHYGMPDQILPMHRDAVRLCGTKVSAVEETMRRVHLPRRGRALDLGCAVGASVFKLRHYFDHVVGVDGSEPLLEHARALQRTRETSVTWVEEVRVPQTCLVRLPADVVTDGIEFLEADLLALPTSLAGFDLVIIEKVLECLPDPQRFMAQVPRLVAPGGYFLHVSSYRWSDIFTPPEKQLGTAGQAPGQLDQLLAPHFIREGCFNAAFPLESNPSSFCFGVAEALLFKRC